MGEMLCTECGAVGTAKAAAGGHRCPQCGSALLLPADAPAARGFIERRAARAVPTSTPGVSARAEATGKVLGRALGKLLGK